MFEFGARDATCRDYIADFARRITARRLVLRPRVDFALFTAARARLRLPERPESLPAAYSISCRWDETRGRSCFRDFVFAGIVEPLCAATRDGSSDLDNRRIAADTPRTHLPLVQDMRVTA